MPRTDDLRIRELKELTPPSHLIREFPCSEKIASVTANSRTALHRILHGQDDRMMVVIGPCSIHDTKAAMEYAGRLAKERVRFAGDLEIVMRVYFEKPRTTVGWKGLIMDPRLDGSNDIAEGLAVARRFLLQVMRMGVATSTELLDPITPQYIEGVLRSALSGAHVQQWELFDLMLDTWPELAACQQELTEGVLRSNLTFEPFVEEGEAPSDRALEKQKLVSNAVRRMRQQTFNEIRQTY